MDELKGAVFRFRAHGPHPHDIPKSLGDMITLAHFYLDRLDQSQEVVDLFPAVLATVHVMDWYVGGQLKQELDDKVRKKYERQFPLWKLLKDFANGLKHADRGVYKKPPSSARLLTTQHSPTEWEDIDAWEHLHAPDLRIWRIQHEGEWRSVYTLCKCFLQEFSAYALPPAK